MAQLSSEVMCARLFFNAAFPVMQVLLDDDPAIKKSFAGVSCTVQFGAQHEGGLLCCHMIINDGTIRVVEAPADKPDITLTFSSVAKMNALLRGGVALPAIKGFGHPLLLTKFLSLLMGLTLMSPKARPKTFEKQALKVKMSLYMITRALSVYNKLGDPDMKSWCLHQPDRIYQFRVENGDTPDFIACYLRVKAGKTKSGHGVYTRRSPFVLFRFMSVEGALKVLLKDVAFVEGVEQGCVETIGSPEYAVQLNDFMAILQDMLT